MKIFINAATLRVGGGKSVTINFLRSLERILPENVDVVAVVPEVDEYITLGLNKIRLRFVPKILNKVFTRILLDRWLIKLIRIERPSIVFSMGNIALPIESIPQVLLFHVPYPIYPESIAWKRLSFKEYAYFKGMAMLFEKRLKYASHVLVQTYTAKKRLQKFYGVRSCSVVPNGISLPVNQSLDDSAIISFNSERINLFCLCRYYPNKNLEILLEVAGLIKAECIPISIILTIADFQGEGAKKILRKIKEQKLEDVLINIGPLPMKEVPRVYANTDGLLLPTLLESFSQTYIESMFYKRPVFTSSIDFAIDVCKNNAYYFNPLDASDILKVIKDAFEDRTTLNKKVSAAYEAVLNSPDWNAIAAQILDEIKFAVNDKTPSKEIF